MAHLDARLFGPFQVILDGEPVTGFHSDKVRALLAYLCTETTGPHRREKLAGMLWPDLPESSARANLRRALANLRSAISDHDAAPPFLSITPQTIAFNPDSGEFGVNGRKQPSYLEPGQAVTMRVFLDRSIVEVYVNGCAQTARVFALPDARGLRAFASDYRTQLRALSVWNMKSMWTEAP